MKIKKFNFLNSKIKINIVKYIILLGQKTIIGRGQIRKKIIKFINYFIGRGDINESRFICNVNGIPFNFYNDILTEIKIYFGRNENKEIDFIVKNSKDNSVFIDIGANMGLYTQIVAFKNYNFKNIKIISIDANPWNILRIKNNLKLLEKKIPNIFSIVKVKNCALADKNYKINLDFSEGLATGVTSNKKSANSIEVNCKKLIDIIQEERLTFVSNLKIDIEGYEDKVLINFFESSEVNLYPKNIILEHSNQNFWKVNLLKYLSDIGYKEVYKNKSNIILTYN